MVLEITGVVILSVGLRRLEHHILIISFLLVVSILAKFFIMILADFVSDNNS